MTPDQERDVREEPARWRPPGRPVLYEIVLVRVRRGVMSRAGNLAAGVRRSAAAARTGPVMILLTQLATS